jgi:pimeloyl-ACP methyl ester carboxylesterase
MATQLRARKEGDRIKADGCCTPKEDKTPQKVSVPPRRVLPIVFLPGIMGSNLRLTPKRQRELGKGNNIAWKPDRLLEAADLINASPRQRQMQLDPKETEVDIYDPNKSMNGDPSETSAARHKVEFGKKFSVGINTILLSDDPIATPNPKTKEVKAMERGWGEIYLSSYQNILETCEQQLNSSADDVSLSSILGQDPAIWGAHPECALKPLTSEQYRNAVKGCWFPVHAMGYNWLDSNGKSAQKIAIRISDLIKSYQGQKYKCEKVILVTHSMGGLLARALIHPDMGGIEDQVLGIVHGVMPAIGAPAAYRRMRCGTESGGMTDPANLVLGPLGNLVTAVLGNAQGGLELLPSKAYGNGWLEIRQKGVALIKLPQNGDPYSEIYQLKDSWFRLLRQDWLNPAALEGVGFEHSCELLEGAKSFHERINSTYHKISYAHYGADPERRSWEKISWELDPNYKGNKWKSLRIFSDLKNGVLRLFESDDDVSTIDDAPSVSFGGGEIDITSSAPSFSLRIGPSVGAGDQTVPCRSADQQLFSKKFCGIFRQTGYEHQKSYMDSAAVASTLYSLVRIIEKMSWGK